MVQVDAELPKAQIKRLVKAKLPGGPDDKETLVNKEALLAFSESAKVFISYISTTANDICKEHKRQTISAEDVIKAVEELEFEQFVPQLKEFLEAYKKANKERNQKKAEASKKRKAEASTAATPATGGKGEQEVEAGEEAGEQMQE